MKLWTKILFIFSFFTLFFPVKNIEARSGCCSHHGGVCGCGCCDGTGLSATCAPYYPNCGTTTTTVKTVQPTSTPKPTSVSTKTPTTIPTSTPTLTPTPTEALTLNPTTEPTKTEEISPTSIPQPQVLGTTDTNKPTESLKTSDYIITFSVLGLLGFGTYKLFIKVKIKIKEYFNRK